MKYVFIMYSLNKIVIFMFLVENDMNEVFLGYCFY